MAKIQIKSEKLTPFGEKFGSPARIFLKTSVICGIPHKKAPDASRTRGLRVYLIFMKYNQLLVAHHSNIL